MLFTYESSHNKRYRYQCITKKQARTNLPGTNLVTPLYRATVRSGNGGQYIPKMCPVYSQKSFKENKNS